jgi:3-methylcrotonyl-CoA carboxylase beta subunit
MSPTSGIGRLVLQASRVGGARRYLPASQLRSIATYVYNNHATALSQIQSKAEPSSHDFKINATDMESVVTQMKELHAKVEAGGTAKAREKHLARGKMLPRE